MISYFSRLIDGNIFNRRLPYICTRLQSSVVGDLRSEFQNAVISAFGPSFASVDLHLTAAKANHGDYQSTLALSLAKSLKLPPKDIATKIVDSIPLGRVIGEIEPMVS